MQTNKLQLAVFEDVLAERRRQDDKWGEQNHDPITWSAVLSEENGEVAQEALNIKFCKVPTFLPDYRAALRLELIQTAAVAVAAVECLDREDQLCARFGTEEFQKAIQ